MARTGFHRHPTVVRVRLAWQMPTLLTTMQASPASREFTVRHFVSLC